MEWFTTGEMNGGFLTKPNQVSMLIIFKELIMRFMPQIDPSNVKQVNIKKNQYRTKASKSIKGKKRSEQRDRIHKRPQE